jgi:hypothetical protein
MTREVVFHHLVSDRSKSDQGSELRNRANNPTEIILAVIWLSVLGCANSFSNHDASARTDNEHLPKEQTDAEVLYLHPDGGGLIERIECDSSSDCPEGAQCLPSGYCDLSLVDQDILESNSGGAGSARVFDPRELDAAFILSKLDEPQKENSVNSCSDNSDCELVPMDCCYSCEPEYSTFDVFNREGAAQERERCREVACEDECEGLLLPTLKALCIQGSCVKMDLKYNTASSCEIHSDCRVRSVECCECGASTAAGNLIATSDEAAYRNLVCDADQACDDCIPNYPPEVTAVCIANRCQIADPRP